MNVKVNKINNTQSMMVQSCLAISIALLVIAWSPGVLAAEPGSRASSEDKEAQTPGNSDVGEFEKYRAVFSELTCGDAKALAVRIAPENDEYIIHAIDQRIYLINKAGDTVLVRDSWDYERIPKGGIRNSQGCICAAVAWGCVKDKKGKSYLVVSYWDSGNHIGAEWDEIYDLKGKMVASEYSENIKDVKRKRGMFNKKLKQLGIDYDWRAVRENDIEKPNVR